MLNENLELEIKDLFFKVANGEFKADNLKIDVDKMISAKEFNHLTQELKQYSEYYRISTRNYKKDRVLYLFYKFYFKNNTEIMISVIHRYETPFMFIRYIRVKSINKGEWKMINVNKVDYIKVQLLENKDVSYLSDFDKYIAGIEYNEKSHRFTYGDIKYKNALDIVKDLYIKVKAFYKVMDDNNKEIYFNEILLNIAELMFRLRIDLGLKS